MSTVTMRQDPIAAATIHVVSRTQEINLKPTEKLSPRWLAWVVLVGATESTGAGGINVINSITQHWACIP